MDYWSNQRINYLHPKYIPMVRGFLRDAESKGVILRITKDGHFRSFDLQEDLYNKYLAGGPKAAPAGSSFHNYGLAVDIVEMIDGNPDWTYKNKEIIDWAAEKNGLTGIKNDDPHYQIKGYSIEYLRTLYDNEVFIEGTEWVKI